MFSAARCFEIPKMLITLTELLPEGRTTLTDVNPDAIVRTVPFETGTMVLTIDGRDFQVKETRERIQELTYNANGR